MAENKIRVMYVEDNTQTFGLISGWIIELGYELLPRAISLADATNILNNEKPDVLLLDLKLDKEGDDMTRVVNFAVRRKHDDPQLKILIHSAKELIKPDLLSDIVSSGISYLTKDATDTKHDLDRAIKTALNGGVTYDRNIIKSFSEIIKGRGRSFLTDREWEVAELIAQGKSNKEIASELHLSVARIGEIGTQLLSKLNFDRRTQIATWYIQLDKPKRSHAGSEQ